MFGIYITLCVVFGVVFAWRCDMGFSSVRLLPSGDLYVILSATPDDDGVYADSVFFVKPSDPDYEEFLKDAKPVVEMPEE